MFTTNTSLPPLAHEFDHARIERVSVGPRREATLYIARLQWNGQNGSYAEVAAMRVGGIVNFAEVSAFFAAGPHERSELASIRYAEKPHSKPGDLYLELVFERIEARLVVRCSSLQFEVTPGKSAGEVNTR